MLSSRPIIAGARHTLCPKFSFSKDTEHEDLIRHLNAYQIWLNRPEISQAKRELMMNIIRYLRNNTSAKFCLTLYSTDKSRFTICSNILMLGDFPDILLLKYIIDQLRTIQDCNSSLRDPNLQLATSTMALLLKPHIKETRTIAIGLMALAMTGVFTRTLPPAISVMLCLMAVLATACGQSFTEYRVATALQDRLDAIRAKELGIDIDHAARLEDEFEPIAAVLGDVANSGMRLFMGFFNQERTRLAALAEGGDANNATNAINARQQRR